MREENGKKVKAATSRIAEEMRMDERYKRYFEQYSESSVDYFLDRYANHKATLEVYGDYTKYHEERTLSEYQDDAWERLKEIQFKKLFDLECLWRAEQVTDLQGIEVTKDFKRISREILDYDEIPCISKEDIRIYQKYLRQKQEHIMYCSMYASYPYYESLKGNFEQENDYFDYHNNHTGNQRLLLLPDIRGQKEMKYIKQAQEEKKEAQFNENVKKDKPYLSATEENLVKFGEQFGDKKTANFIKDWWKWLKETPDLVFNWAFEYLRDISPETVPIEANDDWKEALYFAVINHKYTMVADILPTIHEEYLMKKNTGIKLTKEKKDDYDFDHSEWWREHILIGREKKGEPRDFNF